MKITEITVHASRTLPHPIENYANIRPSVTLKADLFEGDDSVECVKNLQRKAEMLVEEHSVMLRSAIEERDILEREAQEIRSLNDAIHRQTQRLGELKEKHESNSMPSWLSLDKDIELERTNHAT
jgi:hypothetical protein